MSSQHTGVCLPRQRRRTRGFTLIELLVVIAIISILAGIVVPKVATYIGKAKKTRAQAEIRSIELALTSMLADSGRSNFNQFFTGVVLTDPTDPAAWRTAVEVYTDTFYTLLRQGNDADFVALGLDPGIRQKLGDSYMELPRDPFGEKYRFCPGPWRIPAATVPIVFRSWRDSGLEDGDGDPIAYVYNVDAKIAADLDLPGNPPVDDRDGFPAPDDMTIYIWSHGDNLECDQLFSAFYGEMGEEYKGGGDDINNWDPEAGYDRFY